DNAAEVAQRIWTDAGIADSKHPYLQRKGVKAHILRITGDGRLIAPMYNADGIISSLQYIDSEGGKMFHKGGAVKGCYATLGEPENDIYIAEGFATGATIYEAIHKPVIITYSAGNIPPVTETIRAKFPTASITIVADNDASGVGQNYAEQAAAKYGARVIVSPVASDVNDFVQGGGDLASLLCTDTDIYTRLQVFTGNEIADEYEAPDEIVEDLITSSTLAMLYGESHSGKTFFAIALAAAVNSGQTFFGKHTDKGNVLYLATEAPRTVRDRLQAIKRYQETDLSNFYVVPMPLNFYTNNGDVVDIVNLCKEIGNVRLIIGDTLARMSAGANENTGEDMGPVMEKFDAVARETGASVLIIHHSGKNKERGSRGWSGMPAHIDAEIEITSDEQGRKTAKVSKQRELGTTGLEIPFKLTSVEMGIGKFGSMKTSCIVEEDDEERQAKKSSKVEEFYRYFENAWTAMGRDTRGGSPYLSRENMRLQLVKDHPDKSERTIKNYMTPSRTNDLIGTLINHRIIESFMDGWVVVDEVRKSALLLSSNSVPKSP
ncbi:MAG: AAA family ATPase, partial [Bacteroidales bacterium]|nr:AAA family ATPase [Bacteroidales bacterium]